MMALLIALLGALSAVSVARAGGDVLRAGGVFAVETTVTLNDAARSERDVGYRLTGRLELRAHAADEERLLLHLRLLSPTLQLKGAQLTADYQPAGSLWDAQGDSEWFALLARGRLQALLLDARDAPDVRNYKRALASLLQFQVGSGERNETDVSGECHILYESISSTEFRKIKRRCGWEHGAVTGTRRVTRYSLAHDARLLAVRSDELLALGHAQLGLKARALSELRRLDDAPAPPARPDLERALADLPARLTAHSPRLEPAAVSPEPAADLSALLSEHAEALSGGDEAGRGGDVALAWAAADLLPAVRRASVASLRDVLEAAAPASLPALCRLLGLAGTAAAHGAADAVLALGGAEPALGAAQVYLGALALAPRPSPDVVRAVLKLSSDARALPVSTAALLAVGAAAARHAEAEDDDTLARSVRDDIVRSLSRCKDEECRVVRLHALGNMRRVDTADVLLQHAEQRSPAAAQAVSAALEALGAAPRAALTHARLDRLQALVQRAGPLEARARALLLLVEGRVEAPVPLAWLAAGLLREGARDLLALLRARLAALEPTHAALRALRPVLPARLRGWEAGGASGWRARAPQWAAGGWAARLTATQLAPDNLLRLATVELSAHNDAQDLQLDALTVQVSTQGLDAFGGGGGGEGEEEGEEPGAALALRVGGARLPDVRLFQGRAALLAHVWAGSASERTAVTRALLPLHAHRPQEAAAEVPLQAGVTLSCARRGAVALALDAAATASLWHRTARARLALRTAAALRHDATLSTAWGHFTAQAHSSAAPRLRIDADLDFYDSVALCVRAHTDDHSLERSVRLRSEAGARRLRVRRRRGARASTAGRTLALGRRNDRMCGALRGADHE